MSLVIACDLFLDLKLYRVPDWAIERLRRKFQGLELIEVNTPATMDAPLPTSAEVYWGNRIKPSIVEGLPRLKWIHFGSVGVDKALVPEVYERGIIVTNSKGIMVAQMVASALALTTALARGLHVSWAHQLDGCFGRQAFDQHFERIGDLEEQNCLIVGYGDVGRRLGKACRALGMRVCAVRSTPARADGEVEEFFTLDRLAEAVRDQDFVVNLLPLTSRTKRVFNEEIFRAMNRNAYFINIGRGETVDQAALTEALMRDRIAGAGLDVFENEPLPSDSPLLQMQKVILTPHVAGVSVRYWEKAVDLVEQNIERYLNRRPLLNVVDLEREY